MPIQVTLSPALESLPDRLRRTLERSHEQAGREMVNRVRERIIGVGAIASFALLRSIDKQYEDRGAIKAWLVGSDQVQAYFVEYGRKPNRRPPPVEPILRWIILKGIGSDRGLAFAIAKSIGKKGFKGRFPFWKAMVSMRPRIEEIFDRNLSREIDAS